MDYAATLLAKLPGASRRDHGIRRLVETLESYLPGNEIESIMDAYEFGAAAHDGQKRQSGEDYISHPVAVAQELADMHMDGQAISAAILHDVVEDTEASLVEIKAQFGDEVAVLVDGVSKLDQIQFRSRAEAQAESFRKMMLAMIEDIRVILVKLADRLHNMQTLDAMPADLVPGGQGGRVGGFQWVERDRLALAPEEPAGSHDGSAGSHAGNQRIRLEAVVFELPPDLGTGAGFVGEDVVQVLELARQESRGGGLRVGLRPLDAAEEASLVLADEVDVRAEGADQGQPLAAHPLRHEDRHRVP